MFDVGGGELLLILLAIVILFGPKKIPEVAQFLGKGLRQFRQAQSEIQTQISKIQQEVSDEINVINKEIDINNSETAVKPENLIRQELPKNQENQETQINNNQGNEENDKLR
ncbi:MAG: twin-arginine translocase TatA/TatE family subunit [Bacteroidota bacterium]